jgi:hypothetical protein
MQNLDKAEFYLERAIRGKIEKQNSGSRNLALGTLKYDKRLNNKMDKYHIKGYKVTREKNLKTVEQVQSYMKTFLTIKSFEKDADPFKILS